MSRTIDPNHIAANRTAWNAIADIHARTFDALLAQVRAPGFSTLDAHEREVFAELGVTDRDVAQLCCNNARELLSLKLAGARRATGFDLSEAFLAQGRALADAAGVELELVHSDLYAIAPTYDGAFDIVYVTVGALGWLPDITSAIARMARLLRPGGALYVYEMHPLLDMLDTDTGLAPRHSYFRTEPYVEAGEPDYLDPNAVVSETMYWYHHTLGDILGATLAAGLRLTRFAEHAHDISSRFGHLPAEPRLPMCYTLVARR